MSRPDRSQPTIRAGAAVDDAAAVALSHALNELRTAITSAGRTRSDNGGLKPRPVHAVRVALRRTLVALRIFEDLLAPAEFARWRKRLDNLRERSGRVRDLDVWAKIVRDLPGDHNRELKRLKQERARADKSLRRALTKAGKSRWISGKSLPLAIDGGRVGERIIDQFARRVIRQRFERVRELASGDLAGERLHKLRLRVKDLRYGLQLFTPCADRKATSEALALLSDAQQRLGLASDLEGLAHRLACEKKSKSDKNTLAATIATKAETAAAAARNHGRTLAADSLAATIDSALEWTVAGSVIRREVDPMVEIKPLSAASRRAGVHLNGHPRPGSRQSFRIAAIDVGTNSTRLIIAQADATGTYRVLDDEKELTRLGRGMHRSGRIDDAAIEHAAATLRRMKSIALGYGVSELQVVATAAAREARNGKDLVKAVREQAGVEIVVIPPEQEAALAYRSAANAFDLSNRPAAVVDIGGGSTEVVVSVGRQAATPGPTPGTAGSGVIDRVFTIPLGAVRLTEQFGGPQAAADERFKDLRDYTRRIVAQHVRMGAGLVPQIVVGTGGTFTTLAAMISGRPRPGVGPTSVQGVEIGADKVADLLKRLRSLDLHQRSRVPGLPAERADIIVAGLVLAQTVLDALQAESVHAHEGGIRDGLLLSMIERRLGASGRKPGATSPLDSVRRFAQACGYERAHSEHVTTLALAIFDQLAPVIVKDSGAGEAELSWARRVLEAASVLHDVGYLINYASHHKHSYHLIMHAELPGWTPRDVGVIANIARYHRGSLPKVRHEGFAALDKADRIWVGLLAGILRVADGLDRSHAQLVTSIHCTHRRRSLEFRVEARTAPEVDLWGAARKADLLAESLGMSGRFVYQGAHNPAPPSRPARPRRTGATA